MIVKRTLSYVVLGRAERHKGGTFLQFVPLVSADRIIENLHMVVEDICPLVVLSSPSDEPRLRIDKEARALAQLEHSLKVPPGTFKILSAASESDIVEALADRTHTILQFSGHGDADGIFTEGENGDCGAIVNVSRVERLLRAAQPHLTLTIFLSCYSSEMATQLIKSVPFLISVQGRGDDDACIEFISRFYRRLFAGDSLEQAYQRSTSLMFSGLETVFLSRRAVDGGERAMILASHADGSVYVDIAPARADLERLGVDETEFAKAISTKIRHHRWAFRYSRQNALFPVGEMFAAFDWENAQDHITCCGVYRLKEPAEDALLSEFALLLIRFHDLYTLKYRSPYRDPRSDERIDLSDGFQCLESYTNSIFEGNSPDLTRLLAQVSSQAAMTRAFAHASLKMAEQKLQDGDLPRVVQHLETALTTHHDLVTALGKRMLE